MRKTLSYGICRHQILLVSGKPEITLTWLYGIAVAGQQPFRIKLP